MSACDCSLWGWQRHRGSLSRAMSPERGWPRRRGCIVPEVRGGLLRWWVRSVRRRLPLTVEELILDAGAVVGPGGAQACAAGLGESGVPAGAAFAPAVAKARLPESRLVTNLGPVIFRNPFSICAAI